MISKLSTNRWWMPIKQYNMEKRWIKTQVRTYIHTYIHTPSECVSLILLMLLNLDECVSLRCLIHMELFFSSHYTWFELVQHMKMASVIHQQQSAWTWSSQTNDPPAIIHAYMHISLDYNLGLLFSIKLLNAMLRLWIEFFLSLLIFDVGIWAHEWREIYCLVFLPSGLYVCNFLVV